MSGSGPFAPDVYACIRVPFPTSSETNAGVEGQV